jgi:acyl carrier protein
VADNANIHIADVQRRVIAVLADYASAHIPITLPNSRLVDDLGMDSLELMAAVTSLEQEFDFRIPDDIIAAISTVEELSEFIAARLSVKNSVGIIRGLERN